MENSILIIPVFNYILFSENHKDIAALLLGSGASASETENNGWSPLNAASAKGYVGLVQMLMRKGANILDFMSLWRSFRPKVAETGNRVVHSSTDSEDSLTKQKSSRTSTSGRSSQSSSSCRSSGSRRSSYASKSAKQKRLQFSRSRLTTPSWSSSDY